MLDNKLLWDIYTSGDEYNPILKDRFNRIPYYASRNRSVFTPMISGYLRERGFNPRYPGGRKFAVCLTHDVDFLIDRTSLMGILQGEFANVVRFSSGVDLICPDIPNTSETLPPWRQ